MGWYTQIKKKKPIILKYYSKIINDIIGKINNLILK